MMKAGFTKERRNAPGSTERETVRCFSAKVREYPTAGVPVTERRPDRDGLSEKPEWNSGIRTASVAVVAAGAFFYFSVFLAKGGNANV